MGFIIASTEYLYNTHLHHNVHIGKRLILQQYMPQ